MKRTAWILQLKDLHFSTLGLLWPITLMCLGISLEVAKLKFHEITPCNVKRCV